MLKIYGDAPFTVSVSTITTAPTTLGLIRMSLWSSKLGNVYLNNLGLDSLTSVTFVDMLYPDSPTPLILIGVPTSNPWSICVMTVISALATPPPESAVILDILIGSFANAPTISNSGLLETNPSVEVGNFSDIFLSFVAAP